MWDAPRVADLAKWDREGLSASEIVRRFAGAFAEPPTRNAVIGKLHRLHGSRPDHAQALKITASAHRRKTDASPSIATTAAPVATAGRASAWRASRGLEPIVETKPLPRLREAALAPLMVTLFELAPHSCRWPYDAPDGFRFCGHRSIDGRYCAPHGALGGGGKAAKP